RGEPWVGTPAPGCPLALPLEATRACAPGASVPYLTGPFLRRQAPNGMFPRFSRPARKRVVDRKQAAVHGTQPVRHPCLTLVFGATVPQTVANASHSTREFAGERIHPDLLAGLDVFRHLDFDAGVE